MMNIPAVASFTHQAARPGTPVARQSVSWRRHSLGALRKILAAWEERLRFRRDLEQRAAADPHLIDDVGLTTREVEAEIAKPFWQR
jgi:uncharacterized protein YjiS (DUF1127 family)